MSKKTWFKTLALIALVPVLMGSAIASFVYVSQEAWVGLPWLDAGFALWLDEEIRFSLGYFLPLSAEDLQTTRRTKAA